MEDGYGVITRHKIEGGSQLVNLCLINLLKKLGSN
jgi:hypothetical protein